MVEPGERVHHDLPLILPAVSPQAGSLWMFGVRVPTRSMLAVTYGRSAMSMTLPAGTVVSALFAVEQYRRIGASRTTTATLTVASGAVSALGLARIYLGGLAVRWTLDQPWYTTVPALLAIGTAASAAVRGAAPEGRPGHRRKRTKPHRTARRHANTPRAHRTLGRTARHTRGPAPVVAVRTRLRLRQLDDRPTLPHHRDRGL